VFVIDARAHTVLARLPAASARTASPVQFRTGRQNASTFPTAAKRPVSPVLDTATNAIVATIPVGQRPWNMGLAPDGRKLYVANGRSNSVSVIDTHTRTKLRDIRGRGARAPLGAWSVVCAESDFFPPRRHRTPIWASTVFGLQQVAPGRHLILAPPSTELIEALALAAPGNFIRSEAPCGSRHARPRGMELSSAVRRFPRRSSAAPFAEVPRLRALAAAGAQVSAAMSSGGWRDSPCHGFLVRPSAQRSRPSPRAALCPSAARARCSSKGRLRLRARSTYCRPFWVKVTGMR